MQDNHLLRNIFLTVESRWVSFLFFVLLRKLFFVLVPVNSWLPKWRCAKTRKRTTVPQWRPTGGWLAGWFRIVERYLSMSRDLRIETGHRIEHLRGAVRYAISHWTGVVPRREVQSCLHYCDCLIVAEWTDSHTQTTSDYRTVADIRKMLRDLKQHMTV